MGFIAKLVEATAAPEVLDAIAKAWDEDDTAVVVAQLRKLPDALRLRAASHVSLPSAAAERAFHDRELLLTYFLDDRALRQEFDVATIEVWMRIHPSACMRAALARADQLSAKALLRVVAGLDPAEAFEILAPRMRREHEMLRLFTSDQSSDYPQLRHIASDEPRFVHLALEFLQTNARHACALLSMNRSPQAVAELRGVLAANLAATEASGDHFDSSPVEAMETALGDQYFIEALADVVARLVKSDVLPEAPLRSLVARHARRLLRHRTARADERVRTFIDASITAARRTRRI
jgi:hypothetical protein